MGHRIGMWRDIVTYAKPDEANEMVCKHSRATGRQEMSMAMTWSEIISMRRGYLCMDT
jgi:hypothetical protein